MGNRKNARISVMLVSIVLLTLAMSGCKSNPGTTAEPTPSVIMIGYCPTMKPHVEDLVERHQNLEPVPYKNSFLAMQGLQAGEVQAILIGRSARQEELSDDLQLIRLNDGLTLISSNPGAILYDDLFRITVLTSEEDSAAENVLPDGTHIKYYQDFDQMLSEMDASVGVLLRWSQVSPDHNLLIPVDHFGYKVTDFRSPHFYYLGSEAELMEPLLNSLLPGNGS